MGLDRLLRTRGDRFIGILNGLDNAIWDPATDRDLAAPFSRGRSRRQGRVPRRPAGAGRVRSGRRRAGHRDDRAPGPAEGLRPARRRHARAAGPGRARDRPGERTSVARRFVPGAGRGIARAGRVHRTLRSRDGAEDLRRRRLLRDALAVRALRPGPDDRAALRDAADRPPHGRPGRHGRRRDGRPGGGDRVRLRSTHAGRAALGVRAGLRAAGGRRSGVGRPGRSGDGGRFRLDDRLGAEVRRGLPAGRRDPARGARGDRGAASRPGPGAAPRSSRRGGSAAANGARRRSW